MKNTKLRAMVECAVLVALASVLSFIKIWQMPLGGAVTLLSMLPLCVFSIRRGIGWGLVGGFLYALIQLFLDIGAVISWGLTPAALIGCLVFDYLLAFTVLGFAGVFRNRGRAGLLGGIVLALVLRLVCHLTSGMLIFGAWMPDTFDNVFVYSLVYNGSYMLPELIFTLIAVWILSSVSSFRALLKAA